MKNPQTQTFNEIFRSETIQVEQILPTAAIEYDANFSPSFLISGSGVYVMQEMFANGGRVVWLLGKNEK